MWLRKDQILDITLSLFKSCDTQLLLNDIFGGFAVIFCGFVWSVQSIVVSLLLYSWNRIARPLILNPKRGGSSMFVLQLFDFSSNWRGFFSS